MLRKLLPLIIGLVALLSGAAAGLLCVRTKNPRPKKHPKNPSRPPITQN